MSVANQQEKPRLTSLSHGGGCGCKIAPGVLANLLKTAIPFAVPSELLVALRQQMMLLYIKPMSIKH